MAKDDGIGDSRKLTNTSYRKHMASRLNESHVPKNVWRHVTGHKQASSLDNYAPLSHKQQRLLSHIVVGDDVPCHLPVHFPEGQLRNRIVPAAVGHPEVHPTSAVAVHPDVPIIGVDRPEVHPTAAAVVRPDFPIVGVDSPEVHPTAAVVFYKRYAELRPSQYCGEEYPFYVPIKNKNAAKDSQWYKKQPVGW
jgi:hypothetical protein